MRLWKAILIGCDKRAKVRNTLFCSIGSEQRGSCALGAAYEAFTGSCQFPSTAEAWVEFLEAFPILNNTLNGKTVKNIIAHLNDEENWPRERIALEFVKPLEDRLENPEDRLSVTHKTDKVA